MSSAGQVSARSKWQDALDSVLRSMASDNFDPSIVEFLLDEIISSGFSPPTPAPGGLEDDNENEAAEAALHSILAEHLAMLLDMDDASIIFAVRDILDAYQSPLDPSSADTDSLDRKNQPAECELCGREMVLTIHHLFPRSEHDYFLRHPPPSLFRADFDGDGQGSTSARRERDPDGLTKTDLLITFRAWLCRPCHSAVHRIVPDNRELGKEYWSVERLMENEAVQRWVGYVGKRQGSGVHHQRLGLRQKR